jgi:hypothetical protein
MATPLTQAELEKIASQDFVNPDIASAIKKQGSGYTDAEWAAIESSSGISKTDSTDEVQRKSTRNAQEAAAMIGGTFEQGYFDAEGNLQGGFTPGVGTADQFMTDLSSMGLDPYGSEFGSLSDFNTFKNAIQPSGGRPAPLNRVSLFEELKEEAGIDNLQDKLGELEDQRQLLMDNFEEFIPREMEGQSLGFATGRVSEEERNVQNRMRMLDRQMNTLQRQLSTKLDTINTYMNLYSLDYQDAENRYNQEFSQNLQLVSGYMSMVNQQLSIQEKQRAITEANYNTIVNAITGQDLSKVSSSTISKLNQFELELGLPQGLYEMIADELKILKSGTSTDASGNEFAWIMTQGEGGQPEVMQIPTGGSGGGGSDTDSRNEFIDAQAFANEFKGSDEELKAILLRDTEDLSVTDINSIIASRNKPEVQTISQPKAEMTAKTLIEKSFEKFFEWSREEEFRIARNKARALLDQSETLTEADKQMILSIMNSLTVDDISI